MGERVELTDQAYITEVLWPELREKLKSDAHDYGPNNHRVLGPRGQFADIWRKIAKLKRGMWDGVVLRREQPREILMDLLGHCFLAIAMIDSEQRAADRAAGVVRNVHIDISKGPGA